MKQQGREIKQVYQKLFVLFCVLISSCVAIQLSGGNDWASLIPERINSGQWWRLISAHFIHINWQHLAMNMAGAALCLAVFREDVTPTHWLYSSLFLSLFSSTLLYLSYAPQQSYVGFSDVLHGWIGIGILAMLPKETRLASTMLILLLAKIIHENYFHTPSNALLDGSRVATESHLFGCLGAGVFSLSFNAELRKFLVGLFNRQKKSDAP